MNKTLLAHLALLVANLIYAINYSFAKDVMPTYLVPSGFILLRVIGALFLFATFYFLFVKEKVEQKDIFRLAICGIFGVAINQLLFFEGLNLTTPINAAIIMTTNPILVIIMSFLIIKEKITFRKGLGIFLGIIGASSLILKGGNISLDANMQIGNLFVFINAVSYGLYLVIVKPMMAKYHPITVMFYVFSFGLLYVLPFGFTNLADVDWRIIPNSIYLEIAFVVVCTTFIAYLFNSTALKQLSPTTVSIYIYLQPILATLFAIFWGADSLDNQKIIASMLIFFGVSTLFGSCDSTVLVGATEDYTLTIDAGTSGNYCASGPTINGYSNIELVHLIGDNDSISNNTSGLCDTYQDYTAMNTSLTVGQSYNLQINLGSCNPNYALVDVAKVFIDWNMDGDFIDAGETVQLISPAQSPSVNNLSFTVPSSVGGSTRMRIVSQSYAYNGNSTLFDACDNTVIVGATEDYMLTIAGTSVSSLWSTGDTTANITVSPSQTTTYWVMQNGVSCTDSVTITVNQPDTSYTNITACDSYSWKGTTYTTSGTYTYTTNKCDSTVILNLIITFSGCTDSTAMNYNPLATCDNGSCIPFIEGCTDPNACNYDSTATVDDGSCTGVSSCTSPTACNYNASATCDDGSCWGLAGCTDSTALNYNAIANCNDGSCTYCVYGCTNPAASNYNSTATCDDGSCMTTVCNAFPTNLYVTDVIDVSVTFGWDNMNTASCMVLKYGMRYRKQGTTNWTTRSAGVGNGLCNFGLQTTSQMLLNLDPATTYEWRMKTFYCAGQSSYYSPIQSFTTASACPDLTNLTVQTFSANHTKAAFSWDTTGAYVYARVLIRVDTVGSSWFTAGGFGIYYPTLSIVKYGLVAGQSYRASARAYCHPTISRHRSWWSPFIFWTQPGTLIRIESENSSIENLSIYPNPSRDIFNITFTTEETQNLRVRIINVIGENIFIESKQQFVGEYTKQISLEEYPKAIYFLEIETNNGVINKKLILQ